MSVNDKYLEILRDYDKLNKSLQDPSIVQNPQKLEKFSKELSHLEPIAANIRKYLKKESELHEAENIFNNNEISDEMRELASAEIEELKETLSKLENTIHEQLKETDPNDKRNAIVEIRAGTGGEEAALFASDIFRMYTRFAESKGWKVEILNTNYTGNGGFKEVIFIILGKGVYGKLKHESGVHRVQRVPTTESSGRIHTSAASVVVLPEIDDVDIKIDTSEIKIDVYRASGPGGQSVNTTDSAVRITHEPTGIVVSCQDEKSQHKNKARAMSILKSKLFELEEQKKAEQAGDIRKSSIKGGDRSVKIRTYNFPDSRVTDHRIKKTWHNLQGILDGDLDEIIKEVNSGLEEI